MANVSNRTTAELARVLQDAVVKCSERCLYQSAKWASELLNSLPQPAAASSPADTEFDSPMENVDSEAPAAQTGVLSHQDDPHEARLEAAEAHKYLMAKTYFDCREYDRCAAVFLPETLPHGQMHDDTAPKVGKQAKVPKSTPPKPQLSPSSPSSDGFPHLSQRSLFLALYAKYISGEKRKDEESEMILGPLDGNATVNKELTYIMRVLSVRLQQTNDSPSISQGWLEYLYGIVHSKSKNTEDAKRWFTRSLSLYAFNWGVWQELGLLVGSSNELDSILPSLPQNLLTLIFHIVTQQQLFQTNPTALHSLKQLKPLFPTSSFLKTQKALLHYHSKDFEKSSQIFTKLLARDPYRLDDLDTYSNILYVMEKRPQLAYLAHLVTAVDRFRPESACVVGNYYALKSEHEKAITYFRRALTLDRSFLSAWTLMGHEYVELKNTQAAIECYRRAVDANRKDYRAWYGLGQTYEVLEMHLYALWYYQRAAALCPYDAKMWNAVGSCLAKMGRPSQAIKAYKRALEVGSYYEGNASSSFGSQATATTMGRQTDRNADKPPVLDPDVLYSIAVMYDTLNNKAEVRSYLELVLAQEEGNNPNNAPDEDSDEGESPDEKLLRSSINSTAGNTAATGSDGTGAGVGVTATTSRARLWLAKLEVERGGRGALHRAMELANELCADGWEVEDAKAMVREVRGRLEREEGE